MMRNYEGSGFQAEELARTKALSPVLRALLPGAEQANKIVAAPVRKTLARGG